MFKRCVIALVVLAFLSASASATVVVASRTNTVFGNKRIVMGTMTISGAPAAAGFAVTASAVGLRKIDKIFAISTTTGYEYSWGWTPSGTGGYMVPMRKGWLDTEQVVIPTVQDSFACARVVDLTTGTDTTLIVIHPVAGPIAQFVTGGCNATTAATRTNAQFTNAGATLYGNMVDTVDTAVKLRAAWLHADTLFFDYNATVGERLAYCGTSLGNMGDLYVPWYDGKMIKVKYMTGAQMYAAGIGGNVGTMYYVKAGTNPAKFVWKKLTGATYPQGATTNGFHATLPNVASSTLTSAVYFIAIGN